MNNEINNNTEEVNTEPVVNNTTPKPEIKPAVTEAPAPSVTPTANPVTTETPSAPAPTVMNREGNLKVSKKMLMIIGGVVIFVILLIVILSLLLGGKKSGDTNEIEFDNVIEFNNLINDLDDKVANNEITLRNSSEKLIDKYNVTSGIMEAKEGVKIGELTAKILVIRNDNFKADVYRGVYEIKEYNEEIPEDDNNRPPLSQVSEYMETFRRETSFMIGHDSTLIEEKLYGESKYKFPLPTEESVYIENRMYTSSYEAEDMFNMHPENEETKKIKYDMNFYMNGNYLVCEIVRFY